MKLIIYIFSSLLMINCFSNGMEIIDDVTSAEKVSYNLDLMPQGIDVVWKNRCCDTMYVRETIRSFSCVNTFFNRYYSADNNQQRIIRNLVRNNYESDESAAGVLKFRIITEKIKYFIDIATNKDRLLSQKDLQDRWYLNVTNMHKQPLVYIAIDHDNFPVGQLIIDYLGHDITCKQLSHLARVVYFKISDTENKDLLLLLQNFHTELKKKILILRRKAES